MKILSEVVQARRERFVICFVSLLLLCGFVIEYDHVCRFSINYKEAFHAFGQCKDKNMSSAALHFANRCESSQNGSNWGAIDLSPDILSYKELARKYTVFELGGHFIPNRCEPRNKIAILFPFRNRDVHFRILLNNLIPFLLKQGIEFQLFVIEQVQNQTFNRGKLLNVGFVEAFKVHKWDCIVLHDVDVIPENERNLYWCPSVGRARHLAVAIDKMKYRMPYRTYIGAAAIFTKKDFVKMNGMSNDYWGWGGEDDDSHIRTRTAGLKILRYPSFIGKYKMIKHLRDRGNEENPCKERILRKTHVRSWRDGLSNLKYVVQVIKKEPIFTRIVVDLLEKESRAILDKELNCSSIQKFKKKIAKQIAKASNKTGLNTGKNKLF